MNKVELGLLEKAFAEEIGAAFGGLNLLQSKSKIATRLVADGYLKEVQHHLDGAVPLRLVGYRLTDLGRLTYCMSCRDAKED